MPRPRTISEARAIMQKQADRAERMRQRQADKVAHSQGYAHSTFESVTRPAKRYADTGAVGISKGATSTAEQEASRRKKVSEGKTLTNADL